MVLAPAILAPIYNHPISLFPVLQCMVFKLCAVLGELIHEKMLLDKVWTSHFFFLLFSIWMNAVVYQHQLLLCLFTRWKFWNAGIYMLWQLWCWKNIYFLAQKSWKIYIKMVFCAGISNQNRVNTLSLRVIKLLLIRFIWNFV